MTDALDLLSVILDQTHRLLGDEVTRERLTQADRGETPAELWSALEQSGLPLAFVSEESGGLGLSPADAFRLVRMVGYHTVPLPIAETMLANGLWTGATGEPVSGQVSVAPCRPDDVIDASRAGDRWVLHGAARSTPWGAGAESLLACVRGPDGGFLLAMLDPTQARQLRAGRNVAYEPRADLDLTGVELESSRVRTVPAQAAEGLLACGALVRAAQMVGAMERCMDHALRHANERVQFGRPIAKFQAVQHMLVVAAGHVAATTAAVQVAAEAWDQPQFGFLAAMAKARAGEAAGPVASICHQVHAAMGFTQEHPLHFATRRLWSWREEFGAEAHWQERIGRQVCAQGGDALWPALSEMAIGA